MPPAIERVKGTHDVLPDQGWAWSWLHRTHERVAGSFGYRYVDSPVIEHTELFERGVGTGTDIVDKEMFTFTDRGGRRVTLRPEGTAGVLRAALDAALTQEMRPLRLHYAGPMFRYDQPQANRHRQFHQVGIETLGVRGPDLDAEVVETAVRFCEALGLRGISVQVNTLGDLDDRRRFREALLVHYTPLEDRLCEDCRRRLRINPLRLLDCRADAALAEGAPRLADALSAASSEYFATVLEHLDGAGVAYTRNHRLVRGLDYYSDTAFEIWHTSLHGAQNALGGGGRYDGLAEELGRPHTPGVGYAMGVERLLSAAAAEGSLPPAPPAVDAVVISLAAAQAVPAAAVARRLRGVGLRIVLDASDRKTGAKLRAAARADAAVTVLLGEAEVAAGTAAVKDMAAQAQDDVPQAELEAAVRRIVEARPHDPGRPVVAPSGRR